MPSSNPLVALKEAPYGSSRGDLIVTVVHHDRGRVEAPEGHAPVSQKLQTDSSGLRLYKSVYYHFLVDHNEVYEWKLFEGTYFKVSLFHF